MRTPLNTLLCLLFLLTQMQAQFPDNFEFLDHNQRWSTIGANLMMGDSLIYVCHNGQWPMTEIKIATKDNQIETVFSSFLSSESTLVKNSDGTHDIILFKLIDYDVLFSGYINIHIDEDQILIQDYTGLEEFVFPNDIIRDSSGMYWTHDQNRFIQYDGKEIITEFEYPNARNHKFYRNHDGKIYTYEQNQIFYFEFENVTLHITIPDFIRDIQSQDSLVLIFTDQEVFVYDSSFENFLFRWNLSGIDIEFKGAYVNNNNIIYPRSKGELNELVSLDPNNNETILYVSNQPNEKILGFYYLNDDTYILIGHLGEEVIYKNVFFRHINIHNPNEYVSSHLDLLDFKFHRTTRDERFQYVNSNGDSIFYYDYHFDYEVTMQNNSDFIVQNTDIFAPSFYTGNGPFSSYLILDSNEDLIQSEIKIFKDTVLVRLTNNKLEDYKLVIPGANNRFNRSPLRSIVADYTSSIHDPDLPIRSMHIFPNPAYDFIAIGPDITVSRYLIYDMNGILVQGGTMNSNQVDLSTLTSGVYILKASDRSGKELYLSRFIKQ